MHLDDRYVSNFRRGASSWRTLGEEVCALLDATNFSLLPEPLKRLYYRPGHSREWPVYVAARAIYRFAAERRLAAAGRESLAPSGGAVPSAGGGWPGEPIPAGSLGNRDVQFAVEAGARLSATAPSPTFKFFHLHGVHPPHELDADLRLSPRPRSREAALAQARASLKIAGRLIDALRRRGALGGSMIIIVGDHGLDLPVAVDRVALAALGAPVPPGEWNPRMRGVPLVLAKPFGAAGSLAVSTSPVALGDVPRTIDAALGGGAITEGRDLFAPPEPGCRPRRYYHYHGARETAYVDTIVEYAVEGHSWLAASWRKTGREFPPAGVPGR